jgi:hypothetical protein
MYAFLEQSSIRTAAALKAAALDFKPKARLLHRLRLWFP